jgi:hypothetical protein
MAGGRNLRARVQHNTKSPGCPVQLRPYEGVLVPESHGVRRGLASSPGEVSSDGQRQRRNALASGWFSSRRLGPVNLKHEEGDLLMRVGSSAAGRFCWCARALGTPTARSGARLAARPPLMAQTV